ncbi:15737_t:CDS:2 [Entrophospora sp. SA101]|nr:15737_t:CDS:2 [Entrophospora sp. SA101]CAJ0845051.1 6464_t:CDS:2 [Entrophospora sp. SA101]
MSQPKKKQKWTAIITKILHDKEKWLDASSTTHHNTFYCRQSLEHMGLDKSVQVA